MKKKYLNDVTEGQRRKIHLERPLKFVAQLLFSSFLGGEVGVKMASLQKTNLSNAS
jgi:hypothetical protein